MEKEKILKDRNRDMKPENILVATDYTCKISDLGVSTFKRFTFSPLSPCFFFF